MLSVLNQNGNILNPKWFSDWVSSRCGSPHLSAERSTELTRALANTKPFGESMQVHLHLESKTKLFCVYHGTFHCGKGEPGQAMHLSHKTAPARFKNIVVNVKA